MIRRRSALSRFVLDPLHRFTRRFDFHLHQSRDLSDTRFGAIFQTTSVLADWDLAASVAKTSVMVSFSIMLGYWSVSISVIV